jgi:hypothetical protein
MVQNWIFQTNLEAFIAFLAQIAKYPLDKWDYDAIRAGLDGTNVERNAWFDYKFEGKACSFSVQLADDPGSSVLHVRVGGPTDTDDRIELAFFVAQSFTMTPHASVK